MSTREKKSMDFDNDGDEENAVVIVAVKACKEISKSALTWALTHVVRPGDCVKLLVVIPYHGSSFRLWSFPKFRNDCTYGDWTMMPGTVSEQKDYITDVCNAMLDELEGVYDPNKVTIKMKVVCGSKHGAVASEAKKAQAEWILLDKRIKKEAHFCMEKLDCNVIVVNHFEPKVLRLNFIKQRRKESEEVFSHPKSSPRSLKYDFDLSKHIKVPNVTPTSSPIKLFSISRFMSKFSWDSKVKHSVPSYGNHESDSETDSNHHLSTLFRSNTSKNWVEDLLLSADEESSKNLKPPQHTHNRNVREMISLHKKSPQDSPPLCSICHHKSPSIGQPPRSFSYNELEQATNGFSPDNFLAEGGYGCVYSGTLADGQFIAVKQHKLASAQGDMEFCSEVQVLSCAQHRNVVMLLGYCVEDGRRWLVYEFICNGSLDSHLYGDNQDPLDWAARRRIAIGAARGLRYLHEECRVGCIVHRDLRPNNILITHDFEPLVGDFGLARFQADGDTYVQTRVIGAFGYLAPEYAQTGLVSEKSDVYSFGVVLVDLVTGRKAVDITRPKGEQCLTEWARPLLEENDFTKLVDPCLTNRYSEKEVKAMMHCALLCLQKDPRSRPRMSQVLRMLEGEMELG